MLLMQSRKTKQNKITWDLLQRTFSVSRIIYFNIWLEQIFGNYKKLEFWIWYISQIFTFSSWNTVFLFSGSLRENCGNRVIKKKFKKIKYAWRIIIFLLFLIWNYISNKNFISNLKGKSQKLSRCLSWFLKKKIW